MFRLNHKKNVSISLVNSRLFKESSFYGAFNNDIRHAKKEVFIESPFITTKRLDQLLPIIVKLSKKDVKVIINTKDPTEQDGYYMRIQSELCFEYLQDIGATVLFTGEHHRKLAIIDRQIPWEGSLNILSQNNSCEIMQRITSQELCKQMISFTDMRRWL
jgi:glycerophosphoryl diester phosphodiesterase